MERESPRLNLMGRLRLLSCFPLPFILQGFCGLLERPFSSKYVASREQHTGAFSFLFLNGLLFVLRACACTGTNQSRYGNTVARGCSSAGNPPLVRTKAIPEEDELGADEDYRRLLVVDTLVIEGS